MDTEKKPKRPRIGARPTGQYEKVNYPTSSPAHESMPHSESTEERPARRPYQQREGYQPRPYNGNGYQQRPYNNNYNNNYRQGPGSNFNRRPAFNTDDADTSTESTSSQPRTEGYRRDNGYNQHDNNQGYKPRQYNSQGGYQQRQGGYQQRQGGYQQRQGGYGQQRQGGYQQRQNGYGQQRQGGYQQRQGGYQQRQNGYGQQRYNGYGQQRQGGYQQRQQGGYQQRPQQRFTPRPRQMEYTVEPLDPNSEMRLNKYMSNAGVCSRREADEKILAGAVTVNGTAVTELGFKIKPGDVVEYNGAVVVPERKCYVLLNKPKDCVTTCDDPNGRTTVMEIVKNACKERIYPVGRLDRNTTGVLLLTNDGDLASKLTHPKFVKKKIYHVWTDKDITEEDMQRLADGVELEDGEIHADEISYVSETDRNQAGIEIHSGKNRIVRRMFEALGYRVVKLDRVYFAGLTKKNLPRGRWRYLTQEEVNFLKMGSFE